jgi:hypothetical protein
MNSIQKIIAAIWVIASVILTFLHNPVSGYAGIYDDPGSYDVPLWDETNAECKAYTLARWRQFDTFKELAEAMKDPVNKNRSSPIAPKFEEYKRMNQLCLSWSKIYYKQSLQSPTEWYTLNPVSELIRTLPSFLWAQICVAAIAVALLCLARKARQS